MKSPSPNPGAFIYKQGLLDEEELGVAAALAEGVKATRVPVHNAGRYAELQWFQVELDQAWPIADKLLQVLGAKNPEMLVFYYLEPGAYLHPHRDLTGASLNNRLRFHVPVITHDDVEFHVHGQRVRMAPGDLWCLDTSYVHSVHNKSNVTRVHMIVECAITDEIRRNIPSGFRQKIHSIHYASILAAKFIQAIVVNSIKDPSYFKDQIAMIFRFVGWRFLGRGRAS